MDVSVLIASIHKAPENRIVRAARQLQLNRAPQRSQGPRI
jgi:hypothetical protein